MSDNLIERAKDLIDGITDEPWVTVVDEGDPYDVPIAADGKYISRCPDCGVRGGFSEPDAEFIAAARSLVPELFDEVVKLRARIEIIRCLSSANANAFHVIGDACREKAWLDILAVIERELPRG